MDVYFADRRLAGICASEKKMKREFGVVRAKRLAVRLQQLRVADSLADMRAVTGRVHTLSGDLAGLVAVDLDGPNRLLLEPLDPVSDARDLGEVRSVAIVGIADYH